MAPSEIQAEFVPSLQETQHQLTTFSSEGIGGYHGMSRNPKKDLMNHCAQSKYNMLELILLHPRRRQRNINMSLEIIMHRKIPQSPIRPLQIQNSTKHHKISDLRNA